MNYFSRNRMVFWLLIFLVVVNIAALTTLIVWASSPGLRSGGFKAGPGMAFRRALSLNPAQSARADNVLNCYRGQVDPMVLQIRDLRMGLFGELNKDQPDTVYLNKTISEITLLQGKMQKAMVSQYLEMKKICDPEQCCRLRSLYSEMYGYGTPGMGKGMGKGKQHRWRGGCPMDSTH